MIRWLSGTWFHSIRVCNWILIFSINLQNEWLSHMFFLKSWVCRLFPVHIVRAKVYDPDSFSCSCSEQCYRLSAFFVGHSGLTCVAWKYAPYTVMVIVTVIVLDCALNLWFMFAFMPNHFGGFDYYFLCFSWSTESYSHTQMVYSDLLCELGWFFQLACWPGGHWRFMVGVWPSTVLSTHTGRNLNSGVL